MAEKKERYTVLDDDPVVYDTYVSWSGERAWVEFFDNPPGKAPKRVRVYLDVWGLESLVAFYDAVVSAQEHRLQDSRQRMMQTVDP